MLTLVPLRLGRVPARDKSPINSAVSLFLRQNEVGKTTRPFRYDVNQIPCDYTVEVKNRFKELDLIDRVPDELWTEFRDIVQGDREQDHPQEKEMQKKQNGCLRRPYK